MNSMKEMMAGMSKWEMPEMMKKMMEECCAEMSEEETKDFVERVGEKVKTCCGI